MLFGRAIMKVVILAGGFGTRISEETHLKPKPMIEIGGKPILWHIMKIYSAYGLTEFVICLGYKGYIIKEYFANYFLHTSDVTFDLSKNSMITHRRSSEPWRVTLIDTGENTQTGGRLRRVREYLGEDDFCFTYGDGVANVDIKALIAFHRAQKVLATVTAVQPPGRFGMLTLTDKKILGFREKPDGDGGWINGGFFVLSPRVVDYIEGDDTVWERGPLERLASEKQLAAHVHNGFWQPMDHLRDRQHLESLWTGGQAPWKVWE
jgi:glucose-1-phosphate cytidylyltransferase